MERPWYKWYDKLKISREVQYPIGKKPIHEYLRWNAGRFPDKTGVIFYGTKISFKQMDEMSDRVCNYLLSKGVKKGDRIGIYMLNSPEHIAVHFGILKAGAILSPLNVMFKEMELKYQIMDAGMVGVFCNDILYPSLKAIRGDLPTLKFIAYSNFNDFLPPADERDCALPEMYTTPRWIPADEPIDDLLPVLKDGDATPYEFSDWDMNETCMLVYTSGTSGLPKGAMLSHIAHLYKPFAAYFAWGYRHSDIAVAAMPFYHIAGMDMMLATWIVGMTSICLVVPDPLSIIISVDKYAATKLYAVAPVFHGIAGHPEVGKYNLTSLTTSIGSSFVLPMNEDLCNKFMKVTDCPVMEASFGLSETHTLDTMMPFHMVKWGAQGIPLPENDIKITDIEDPKKELPYGEQGEICIKGPGTMLGYWNRPDVTETALIDGYVLTGDMGMIDEDGYLFWLGRFKEMIKVSGVSVFPEDVESLLSLNPAVAESAVISVPDERKGEVVKAFIVLRPTAVGQVTEEDITNWAKEKMSPHKVPRYVEFRTSLPKSGANKLLRRELQAEENAKRS